MSEFSRTLETALSAFSNFMWGPALIVLLVGGGLFLAFYSRFRPYLHFKHALDIVRGKFDRADDAGDIPHFQALSTALSGTLGLGNVAGVATALTVGGSGAIFWMWFYFVLIFLGSIASFQTVIGLVFGMYAVMAIPTMLSTLRLAPRVNQAAERYFKNRSGKTARWKPRRPRRP